MKRSIQNGLLLAGSLLIHIAAFRLMAPAASEIGKNTPVLAYPIRVRMIESPAIQASLSAVQAAPAPGSPIAPLALAGLAEEGRLDANRKHYRDSSGHYFKANELDSRPAILSVPDLDAMAVSPLTEGAATLRLFINEMGAVDRMDVEQSTLPALMIEQLIVQRGQMLFTPGNKNGLNVKSVILYQIELAREASVTPVEQPREPAL